MATVISNDIIELGTIEAADKSLALMVRPREESMNSTSALDEKEELFTLKIQVKQEVIEAIINTGS